MSGKSGRHFVDLSTTSYEQFTALAEMSSAERNAAIAKRIKPSMTNEELKNIAPMSLWEEMFSMCIFLFGVPGAVVTIPAMIAIGGMLCGSFLKAFGVAMMLIIPLMLLPIKFKEKSLTSWAAFQILRYFSFKCVYAEPIPISKPHILVAPPHGVFPFGNIVTMISFPSVMGFPFTGLASSAAFMVPMFRQILTLIGAVDASKATTLKALRENRTVGISTGGVAEIFETNTYDDGDEIIVLKNRKGMIKLAFVTGASLVPCYLFGNSHLLGLWSGGRSGPLRSGLKALSRRIGGALIVFWGRFGLPIPYRVPILGAMGPPIAVPKKENPTSEDIEGVQQELFKRMTELFDEHKHAYGWGKKTLVII